MFTFFCFKVKRMFIQSAFLFLLTIARLRFHATETREDRYVNRTIKYGKIIGRLAEFSSIKAEVFLSVPYAQPPLGHLRFSYPVPPTVSSNTLRCTEFKSICPQNFETVGFVKESEDCLYLNIFVPYQKEQKTKYPVLAWIHGGSYLAGSGNKFPINSTIKNLVSEDIIVVFINYRLGPLGFLSLGNATLPGNYGLEDQLLALRWIQENIHYFNGDPNQVTLTGESAGGASVSLLAISKKARGLFQRVMHQSGCSLSTWAHSEERTIRNTEHILTKLNCTRERDEQKLLACLRNVTLSKIMEIFEVLDYSSVVFIPTADDGRKGLNHGRLPHLTPVIDKYRNYDSILEDSIENLLKRNSNLTLLIGTTNFEDLEYVQQQCIRWERIIGTRLAIKFMSINLDVDDFDIEFPNAYQNKSAIYWEVFLSASLFKNPKLAYRAIETYYNVKIGLNKTDYIKLIAKIGSDWSFIAPAVQEASYYASNNNSVYFYYYSEENNKAVIESSPPFDCGIADHFKNAAAHGHDLARLFQSNQLLVRDSIPNDEWETGNLNMTNLLSKIITNFVKTGNPNGNQNELKWSKFTEENKSAFFLHPKNPKMIDIEIESNYKFWYEILPMIENLTCSK